MTLRAPSRADISWQIDMETIWSEIECINNFRGVLKLKRKAASKPPGEGGKYWQLAIWPMLQSWLNRLNFNVWLFVLCFCDFIMKVHINFVSGQGYAAFLWGTRLTGKTPRPKCFLCSSRFLFLFIWVSQERQNRTSARTWSKQHKMKSLPSTGKASNLIIVASQLSSHSTVASNAASGGVKTAPIYNKTPRMVNCQFCMTMSGVLASTLTSVVGPATSPSHHWGEMRDTTRHLTTTWGHLETAIKLHGEKKNSGGQKSRKSQSWMFGWYFA